MQNKIHLNLMNKSSIITNLLFNSRKPCVDPKTRVLGGDFILFLFLFYLFIILFFKGQKREGGVILFLLFLKEGRQR